VRWLAVALWLLVDLAMLAGLAIAVLLVVVLAVLLWRLLWRLGGHGDLGSIFLPRAGALG
jgi:hypothetical protein